MSCDFLSRNKMSETRAFRNKIDDLQKKLLAENRSNAADRNARNADMPMRPPNRPSRPGNRK